jgi:hypothetical protein
MRARKEEALRLMIWLEYEIIIGKVINFFRFYIFFFWRLAFVAGEQNVVSMAIPERNHPATVLTTNDFPVPIER